LILVLSRWKDENSSTSSPLGWIVLFLKKCVNDSWRIQGLAVSEFKHLILRMRGRRPLGE
jgi:hypothetical protein